MIVGLGFVKGERIWGLQLCCTGMLFPGGRQCAVYPLRGQALSPTLASLLRSCFAPAARRAGLPGLESPCLRQRDGRAKTRFRFGERTNSKANHLAVPSQNKGTASLSSSPGPLRGCGFRGESLILCRPVELIAPSLVRSSEKRWEGQQQQPKPSVG